MGTFIVFILKSTCCLILFYLFYRLLLSRDTFHRFNRFVLLCVIGLSIAIPFIKVVTGQPVVIQRAVSDLETLLQIEQSYGQTEIEVSSLSLFLNILFLIYIGGCLFFLSRFLYSTFRIVVLIRSGRQIKQEENFKLIVTSQPISPFSWMRYMVISRIDLEADSSEIFIHEQTHIKAGHSWDMLLAGIFVVLHWFNPAAWLLKQELQNIHEYEADEGVLKRGVDPKKYQLLLIKKAVGTQRFTSMANSFNHSKLKKRISMMIKQKSNPWMRLKFLYIFPLTIITVVAFARPEITLELNKISNVAVILNTEPSLSETEIVVEQTPLQQTKKEKVNTSKENKVKITAITDSRNGFMNDNMEIMGLELKKRSEPGLSGNYSLPVKGMIHSRINTNSIRIPNLILTLKDQNLIKKNPLLIVDGKEYLYDSLAQLNPDLIESITVLKDVSARKVYGDKGKNGVILIVLKNEEKKH